MRGCEVGLTLAVPVPKVQVPNFVGLSRDQALRGLPRFFGELSRGSVIEVDSRRPAGTVVDQDPKAGTWVRRGSPVNLYVARYQPQDSGPGEAGPPPQQREPRQRDPGTPQVMVPNLISMNVRQARLVISRTEGALRLGTVRYRPSNQVQAGTVIQQDPGPGQTVPVGTVINLLVATNPEPAPTPTPVIIR